MHPNDRFSRLYETHADRVFRFCLRLCNGNRSDAEDLAQDVFVAACAGLPRFAGRASTQTWLFRIAVYRWRRLIEREAAWQTFAASASPAPQTTTPTTAVLTRISLDAALERLAPPLREAFVLVKSEGLTHREAAGILGVPQGTVQSRVHDAVHRLRILLTEEATDD